MKSILGLPRRHIASAAMGALVGGAGFFLYDNYVDHTIFSDPGCQKSFPLTSSALDCGEYNDSHASIKNLDKQLDDAADLYVQEKKATRISIWVRDLETKQWASTNETDAFAPASLFKVPLMMTYFKFAELDPTLLSQSITYDKLIPVKTQDYMEPSESLVLGQSYTIDELIRRMIVDSDNVATQLLNQHIQPEAYAQTVVDLGMKIPTDSGTVDFVTAKSYANMFRLLYDASYLNREYSEKALGLLSKTTYKGIVDPLPSGTVVAHKFGERTIDKADGPTLRQLHDCGIVYKSPRPYSVCIMTEGTDFDQLSFVLHNISLLVYQNM